MFAAKGVMVLQIRQGFPGELKRLYLDERFIARSYRRLGD